MQLNLTSCLISHAFLPYFLLHNGHLSSSNLMISLFCLSLRSMSLDSLISSFSPFLIFQNLKSFNLHNFFPWTWDKSPKYRLNSWLGSYHWFRSSWVIWMSFGAQIISNMCHYSTYFGSNHLSTLHMVLCWLYIKGNMWSTNNGNLITKWIC